MLRSIRQTARFLRRHVQRISVFGIEIELTPSDADSSDAARPARPAAHQAVAVDEATQREAALRIPESFQEPPAAVPRTTDSQAPALPVSDGSFNGLLWIAGGLCSLFLVAAALYFRPRVAIQPVAEWTSPATIGTQSLNESGPHRQQEDAEASSRPDSPVVVVPADGWVDLLSRVDVDADAQPGGGGWTREGNGLRSPKQEFGRISVPAIPRGDYELRVDFMRASGNDAVDIFLPVTSQMVQFVFDGWGGKGLSGLQSVDGREEPDPARNEGLAGFRIENGRRYLAEIAVTIDGSEASIAVRLDGRPITDWKGSATRLSLINERFHLNDPRRIGIGAWDSAVVFDSLRLRMLNGDAEIRPQSAN